MTPFVYNVTMFGDATLIGHWNMLAYTLQGNAANLETFKAGRAPYTAPDGTLLVTTDFVAGADFVGGASTPIAALPEHAEEHGDLAVAQNAQSRLVTYDGTNGDQIGDGVLFGVVQPRFATDEEGNFTGQKVPVSSIADLAASLGLTAVSED